MGWHYVVRFKWDVDGMMGVGCYLTCASLNDVVQALRRAHNHTIFQDACQDALALEVEQLL